MLNNQSYGTGDDVFSSQSMPDTPSTPPIKDSGRGFSDFSSKQNGKDFNGDQFGGSDGSILPPAAGMAPEEGSALREWRRQNLIRLEEKEKKEKEMLEQIIKEAEEYKVEFYRKKHIAVENNKASNREKEKLFLENREKFHAGAAENYWKAIAELIPHEVPTIETREKKDKEKKPSIVVIQGPKPGKPTDRSRMRQILVRLKHNPPPHMKPKPPTTEAKKNTSEHGTASDSPPPKVAAATNLETVAAA